MKFGCESCGAQYMIADEKVGKAGVKVRCKKCSHVIVVRPQAKEESDQATVVMDNPLAGMEPTEAPSFDDSADMEIGAAFDSIFGEGGESEDSPRPASPAPKDPFAAAVDNAFDAALGGGPLGEEDDEAADSESTRVFSSADMQRVAEEREYAAGPLFDDSRPPEPDPDEESDDDDDEPKAEWYVAINDDQVGPLTIEEVREHWESRKISGDSLVWRQGLPDWEPLSVVDELKSLASAGPARGRWQQQPAAWEGSSASGRGGEDDSGPDDEGGTWKPAGASLLASLAQEEMSALDQEGEESSELAGPSADPVAEPPSGMVAMAQGLGLDQPSAAQPNEGDAQPEQQSAAASTESEAPKEEPVAPAPAPVAPAPTPTPAPHFSTHSPQAPGPAPGPMAPAHQQGFGAFSQQPMGGPIGGYRPSTLAAASPMPFGMSKRMLLAVGGGGAGVSALLVVLLLVVTGVIGKDKADPEDLHRAVPLKEASTKDDAKAEEQAAPPEEEPKKEEAESAEESEDNKEEEAAVAKKETAEASKEPATKASAPRAKQRTPPPQRQRTTPAPRQARAPSPPPKQEEAPSPPPQRRQPRPPPDDEDLEAALFGGSTARGQRSGQQSQDTAPSGRGYIPSATGSRDRDLPREVSRGDIMQVVRSKQGDLRGCVSRQRAADPGASGRVVMGWRIQPDGTPSAIRVKTAEHRGSVMAQCLTQVIGTMRFPRYGGPPMSEIEFPFDF